MQRTVFMMITALFVMIVIPYSSAKSFSTPVKMLGEKTEEVLLQEIESEDIDIKASSALTLGNIHSEKAVIPLLKVLKSDDDERARISAAISLWKIGDSRGIYAIKKAIQFDDSKWVQKICKILYLDTIDTTITRF